MPTTGQPFVQLQIKPGIFGVTKLKWRTWPERSWLSFALAVVFIACGAALIWVTHQAVPDPPGWYQTVRIICTIILSAAVIFRLILEKTVSKSVPGSPPRWDGYLLDPWWTPIHFFAGVTFGVWLTPFVVAAIVTVAWEIFEITVPGFGDDEINGNRMFDILFGWAGWLVAALIIGGKLDQPIPFI